MYRYSIRLIVTHMLITLVYLSRISCGYLFGAQKSNRPLAPGSCEKEEVASSSRMFRYGFQICLIANYLSPSQQRHPTSHDVPDSTNSANILHLLPYCVSAPYSCRGGKEDVLCPLITHQKAQRRTQLDFPIRVTYGREAERLCS